MSKSRVRALMSMVIAIILLIAAVLWTNSLSEKAELAASEETVVSEESGSQIPVVWVINIVMAVIVITACVLAFFHAKRQSARMEAEEAAQKAADAAEDETKARSDPACGGDRAR